VLLDLQRGLAMVILVVNDAALDSCGSASHRVPDTHGGSRMFVSPWWMELCEWPRAGAARSCS
jgi:hypothetical protein